MVEGIQLQLDFGYVLVKVQLSIFFGPISNPRFVTWFFHTFVRVTTTTPQSQERSFIRAEENVKNAPELRYY